MWTSRTKVNLNGYLPRRSIHAAVGFIDVQVGRILKCLDVLNLNESTAVVVWGDHGFHRGDQRRAK